MLSNVCNVLLKEKQVPCCRWCTNSCSRSKTHDKQPTDCIDVKEFKALPIPCTYHPTLCPLNYHRLRLLDAATLTTNSFHVLPTCKQLTGRGEECLSVKKVEPQSTLADVPVWALILVVCCSHEEVEEVVMIKAGARFKWSVILWRGLIFWSVWVRNGMLWLVDVI